VDSMPGLDSLLSPEGGRILVTRAPLAVIASLPGVTEEAVTRIASHRAAADRLPEWPQLAAELSSPSRVELMRNLLELGRLSAFSPDAWVVEVTATDGRSPLSVTRRVQLNPSGTQILPAATLLSPD
jgi:hypothetical protein